MYGKAQIIGRLTKDPELKTYGNNKVLCNFSLAYSNGEKNQQNEYVSYFISCTAFGKIAEYLHSKAIKGSLIFVNGSLGENNYTSKSGQEVKQTRVMVNELKVLDSRKESNPVNTAQYQQTQPTYPAYSQQNQNEPFIHEQPYHPQGQPSQYTNQQGFQQQQNFHPNSNGFSSNQQMNQNNAYYSVSDDDLPF